MVLTIQLLPPNNHIVEGLEGEGQEDDFLDDIMRRILLEISPRKKLVVIPFHIIQ